MAQYQVVGQCAHVRTMTQSGRMTLMLFKGSLLPPDVPVEQIQHLLSVKLIKRVGEAGPELPGAAVPDTGVQPSPAVEVPAVSEPDGEETPAEQSTSGDKPVDDPERVAARAKLPDDGSLPHHASGQPVWVEYLVGRGYDYSAIQGQDKSVLVDLAKTAATTQ